MNADRFRPRTGPILVATALLVVVPSCYLFEKSRIVVPRSTMVEIATSLGMDETALRGAPARLRAALSDHLGLPVESVQARPDGAVVATVGSVADQITGAFLKDPPTNYAELALWAISSLGVAGAATVGLRGAYRRKQAKGKGPATAASTAPGLAASTNPGPDQDQPSKGPGLDQPSKGLGLDQPSKGLGLDQPSKGLLQSKTTWGVIAMAMSQVARNGPIDGTGGELLVYALLIGGAVLAIHGRVNARSKIDGIG